MSSEPSKFHANILGTSEERDIVWLHGWGQSGKSMEPLARLFETSANNIIFDLPGFGATPRLETGAGTEAYAHALRAQLTDKKNKERIIVGHSFGCRVAVRFANAYPDQVDAMVFIAGAGLKRNRSFLWRLKAFTIRMVGSLAKICDSLFKTQLKNAYSKRFGSADYRNAGALRETFVNVVNEDLSNLAADMKIPVLLIYGSEDNEAPIEIGTKYATLMNNAVLKILDGYNHFDILTRGAHKCQFLIDKFLNSLKTDPTK